MDAGAVDFLPKNFEDISRNPAKVKQLLCEKILSIARSNRRSTSFSPSPAAAPVSTPNSASAAPAPTPHFAGCHAILCARAAKAYRLVAIGTSTGGPVALQRVLTQLPANPAPIVLIQHMPAAFTKAFAERLNSLCRISVKEAEDGDLLRPGVALLAPGGKQMMIDGRGQIKILPGDERLNYKPCVDITFGSAAKAYADKVLAVVLTGMGADGRDGARMLKEAGSQVWAQDEASCVIYMACRWLWSRLTWPMPCIPWTISAVIWPRPATDGCTESHRCHSGVHCHYRWSISKVVTRGLCSTARRH